MQGPEDENTNGQSDGDVDDPVTPGDPGAGSEESSGSSTDGG
jgi:hypothetical protein